MLWEKKLWPPNESTTKKSHKPKSHKNQAHEKHGSEIGEPFSNSGHVLRATRVHQSHVLQTSIQHLHRTRKGQWLSAGVSEINLRNPILNHTIRRGFHNPLHLNIWPSGTWTMTGKMWTIQVSRLKVSVSSSYRKTKVTWGTITTIRTWVVTKISRHKAILSRTKTIWAMVRYMRELRQNKRRSVRWNQGSQIYWISMKFNEMRWNRPGPNSKIGEFWNLNLNF
jgi:hypothetical protein